MRFKKFIYKKVKSTNDTAIFKIKKTNFDYGMVISDLQTNGKGQYGKKWISLKGNLFVSFFYNLKKLDLSLTNLTQINCNIVKRTLSEFYKKKIVFKAPNDLLVKNKKICGILQETIKKKDKKFLIIGIGINILESPNIIEVPTTNLFEITGKKFNYKLVARSLKINFEKQFSKFLLG